MPSDKKKSKKSKKTKKDKKAERAAARPVQSELVVSSADDWNDPLSDKVGFVVELPSGRVVRARRTMNLLDLVHNGHIPNPLREIVVRQIADGGAPETFSQQLQQYGEDEQEKQKVLAQFTDFMHEVVCSTVIEPPFDMPTPMGKVVGEDGELVDPDETIDQYMARIVDWKPEPGHASIYMMTMEDKFFLFAMSQGGIADAKRFREGQEAALADLAAVEGDGGEAKRPSSSGRAQPKGTKAAKAGKSSAKKPGGAAKKSAPAKRAPAKKSAGKRAAPPAKKSGAKKSTAAKKAAPKKKSASG